MGLGISSVAIPEISPYTKSEQPRIAGKHLTRHAKNGYSVVSLFLEGWRPLPRSLDMHPYHSGVCFLIEPYTQYPRIGETI